jgi:hypothetical protein
MSGIYDQAGVGGQPAESLSDAPATMPAMPTMATGDTAKSRALEQQKVVIATGAVVALIVIGVVIVSSGDDSSSLAVPTAAAGGAADQKHHGCADDDQIQGYKGDFSGDGYLEYANGANRGWE